MSTSSLVTKDDTVGVVRNRSFKWRTDRHAYCIDLDTVGELTAFAIQEVDQHNGRKRTISVTLPADVIEALKELP